MANNIADQICDAVDVLINKRVSSLQFDRTVRATVLSVENASIGKYRVQYQNSIFYAYADPDTSYKPKAQVYVEIPSSDYNKVKLIVGSVKKLGSEYLSAVTAQGRMTRVGTNILTNNIYEDKSISFCSYDGQKEKNLLEEEDPFISIDENSLKIYKQGMSYFMLGATIQTSLPVEQQVGGGNYGLILEVDYYTTAERESLGDQRNVVTRTYVLDVNNMLGQPYKYLLPDKQYAIFAIDGDNLKEIKSLKAFCKGFPVTKQGQPQDIFLSNIEICFMEALSAQELSNASLKILTPYGSYFTSLNDDTKYLEAELKLKGKIVNLEDQKVDFYWFVKDTSITAADQLYYSVYAGQGWKCLNENQSHGGLTEFIPEGYRKHITIDLTPADITTFKCVAIYNGTILSDTIKIRNSVSKDTIEISSTAGTQFYFDTGKTTLTCTVTAEGKTGLEYYWGYTVPTTGEFVLLNNHSNILEDVSIAAVTSFITYECTVYYHDSNSDEDLRLGSAEITLTNGIPQNEYTLVINNGTQVFKYDEYGVSPASRSALAADRIIIPTLSFDIYNDLGQLVTPVDDAEKVRLCDIKWIWPDEEFTMLTYDSTSITLQDELIVNPTINGNVLRKVIPNTATLTFGIKNRFDLDANDNNIQLEVSFQGHNLVASTNFTFVKEGVLGTNGTKYVSRLIPIRDEWKQVFIQNGKIYWWNNTITKTYDPVDGIYVRNETYLFDDIKNGKPLKVQLWDSTANAIYDSATNTSTIDADLTWDIVDVGAAPDKTDQSKRKTWHNAEVNPDGIITPLALGTDGEYNDISTVIKTTISTSELSEDAQKYYATYPLAVTKIPNELSDGNTHIIVTGGFDECMYNSDGTRGSFKTKPFVFKLIKKGEDSFYTEQPINEQNLTWIVSWYTTKKNEALKGQNKVEISPPSFFDSKTTNNYIKVQYVEKDENDEIKEKYVALLSIHLYLNRYGMAAMNDWDGTSVKINEQGNQYILAPQIGAGKKNDDNSFTGITMGKSFNVDGNTEAAEIGLMGFYKGSRSLFLDSQTGRAEFGITGGIWDPEKNNRVHSGKIVLTPTGYGKAPAGAIYSDNFYSSYDTSGKPNAEWTDAQIAESREDKGMLIDLSTPSIRFGNKNFSVNEEGHLTARGGGSIAGWKIDDENIYDVKETIWINSTAPKIYSGNKNNRHDALNKTNKGFYLGNDGLSFHNTIKITATDENGNGKLEIGNLGFDHWTITGGNHSNSYISYGNITDFLEAPNSNRAQSVYIGTDGITLGNKFSVNNKGEVIAENIIANNTGKIGNWVINKTKLTSENGLITLDSNGNIYGGTESADYSFDPQNLEQPSTTPRWKISSNGTAQFSNVIITGSDECKSALSWGKGRFSVTPQGHLNAFEGIIGNWLLQNDGFYNKGKDIQITPDLFKYKNAMSMDPSGTGNFGTLKTGTLGASAGGFPYVDIGEEGKLGIGGVLCGAEDLNYIDDIKGESTWAGRNFVLGRSLIGAYIKTEDGSQYDVIFPNIDTEELTVCTGLRLTYEKSVGAKILMDPAHKFDYTKNIFAGNDNPYGE